MILAKAQVAGWLQNAAGIDGVDLLRHSVSDRQGKPGRPRRQTLSVGGSGKARIHKTLRVTPAMEAGLSTHAWSVEEIVGLLG